MGKVGPRSRSQSLTPGPTIEEVPEEEEQGEAEVQDLEKTFENKLRQLRGGKPWWIGTTPWRSRELSPRRTRRP